MTDRYFDPPTLTERQEWDAHRAAVDALIEDVTVSWLDPLDLLVWLHRHPLASADVRADAIATVRNGLTPEERATYAIWREGTAEYLTRAMVAKHAARVVMERAA